MNAEQKIEKIKANTANMREGRAKDTIQRGLKVLEESRERRKANGWGGARKGAGGPTKMGTPATKQIAYRITEDQAATLEAHMQEGESRNQTARRLLLQQLDADT